MKPKYFRTLSVLAVSLLSSSVLLGQQHKELGRMWTFENAPMAWFQEAYDFTPSAEWLDHARLSSLRFGGGCSASFVSPHGLIMTNHHCARGNIADVQGEHDWVKDGFYAGGYDNEVVLPDLTVQQLVATTNVTDQMQSGATEEDLLDKAKADHPDLSHEMVALYQGGMYQIYSYRIFADVRLVCAPQGQVAHFGGDPDNFCYPRWGLDFTFVRAYVDGKPFDSGEHYFKWKTSGPEDNELVFVTGNPGSTGRLQSLAQCEFLRDNVYPRQLDIVKSRLQQLEERSKEGPEQEKQLRNQVLRMQNTRKAFQGYLDGLQNERIMAIKAKAEADLRKAVAADEKLQEAYGSAWDELAALQQKKLTAMDDGNRPALRQLQATERELNTKIGEACFAVYGTSIPPDATFTLRLSDGLVKGYEMNGTVAPYFTSLYGLYARNYEFGNEYPFHLPQDWLDKEKELDLTTPFNFVATCDIIGGNSGSPMIDAEQNVVGLIFDGNIEMLGNNYVFDDEVSRTVSVHPAIIIESLRKIYNAADLADELESNGVDKVKGAPSGR